MKTRNGSRSGKFSLLEILLSSGQHSRTSAQTDPVDLSAPLQHSHAAMAELTQALMVSQRHSTAIQKRLEALEETNSYLRRELTEVETKASTVNHLAFHDALTGLPNRRLLLNRLNQAISQASRQGKRVALVFFGVDGFKAINDKLGHANGDQLLQRVAQRLCACLRVADTACRYGGDEFIVMLPEIDGEQSAAVVEQKIRAQLAAPYVVDGAMITVSLSIGTAVYPVDANDRWDLIRLADLAMFHQKANGNGRAAPRVEQPTGSAARAPVD